MNNVKLFTIIISVVIVGSIVAGFFIVGSPQEERLRRFDDQRIQDLSLLQGQIIDFWINKDRLPEQLGQLKNDITGFTPPLDPQSGSPYEYRTAGVLSFELCASFSRPSDMGSLGSKRIPVPAQPFGLEGAQNWSHPEGRACFLRTIDPELYKNRQQLQKPVG